MFVLYLLRSQLSPYFSGDVPPRDPFFVSGLPRVQDYPLILEFDRPRYRVGDRITARVGIRNNSRRAISTYAFVWYYENWIVLDPYNRYLQMSDYWRAIVQREPPALRGGPGLFAGPGRFFLEERQFNVMFKTDTPGVYRVRVWLDWVDASQPERPAFRGASRVVTFTIVP